jgi:hypothetical protein
VEKKNVDHPHHAIAPAKADRAPPALARHGGLRPVRQAAAEPGYGGPAIDVVEQVGANIARIRIAVRDWPLNMALRDFSARRQHGGDGEDLRADPRGPAALKLPIFPTST